jgi:hypothetical protein
MLTGVGGVAAALFPPPTAFDVIDQLRTIFGIILMGTTFLAATGVILDHYRLEWVAAWFSTAAFTPFVFIYFWYALNVDMSRIAAACFLCALGISALSRAIFCTAHAAYLRIMHFETLPLEDTNADS